MTTPPQTQQQQQRQPATTTTAPATTMPPPVSAVAQPFVTSAVQMQAQMFRFSSALFGAQVIRDILTQWLGLFDPRHARKSWPAVKKAVTELVHNRRLVAAEMGQDYYAQARAAAGVPGVFEAAGVPPVDAAVLSGTLDSTGPWTFLKGIQAGKTPPQALQGAGVRMSGAASRLVLQPLREVVIESVKADPEAIGWARLTASNPCSFCALLASRGFAYKTEQAAGFKAHDACRCVAVAGFSNDDAELLYSKDLQDAWWKVTDGLSGKDARNAWRRWWNAQGKQLPA